MKKYKIIKKTDSLGSLPYPVGTIVEGVPYLKFIGINVPRSNELYFYDETCFIEIKEEQIWKTNINIV